MTINTYSKQDTSVIKGFAILCIVLHNFLHWIPPFTGENEFYFSRNTVVNFFDRIIETPAEIVNILFTFLGHYGVQIFIFISGFGLTLSMLKHHKTWLNFIIDRLKKLYPLLITAILFYILFRIIMYSELPTEDQFREIGYKMLFIHTLLPYQGLTLNGPWWFFGLIIQLYLVFPFLFSFIRKYKLKAFLIICICSYSWTFLSLYHFKDIFEVYYLQNFPGHLPEFCLGMLLALNKENKVNNIFLYLAIAIFCLGNFYREFFPFTFLSVVVIFLFVYQFFKNISINKSLIKQFLMFLGNISMTLFAVHGFLRDPFVSLTNTVLTGPLGHLTSALLFLITAIIIALAANHVYDYLISIFNKIKLPQKQNKISSIISIILQFSLLFLALYILVDFSQQNNFDNLKNYSNYELSDNFIMTNNKEYYDIVELNYADNDKKLKIEGTVDLYNKDANAELPYLILNIENLLWQKLNLSKISTTANYDTYSFTYEYSCSFIHNLKNKDIKLYFWNKDRKNYEYKNVVFSISTK